MHDVAWLNIIIIIIIKGIYRAQDRPGATNAGHTLEEERMML